jgi:ribosomal protein S17E
MGRIKSLLVKRTAKKLIKEQDFYNTKFDDNKKILGSLMPSKKVRNKIAGYITRLKRVNVPLVK